MLRFILLRSRPDHLRLKISIHPMLRFINKLIRFRMFPHYHFNTSHVTVYQHFSPFVKNMHFDFNTSHVTVYRFNCIGCIRRNLFQYIPCYGLSCPEYRSPQSIIYFNTSHVTVYPRRELQQHYCNNISIHPMLRFITAYDSMEPLATLFQYIPCYGLSLRDGVGEMFAPEFQYIPCYGLSVKYW